MESRKKVGDCVLLPGKNKLPLAVLSGLERLLMNEEVALERMSRDERERYYAEVVLNAYWAGCWESAIEAQQKSPVEADDFWPARQG